MITAVSLLIIVAGLIICSFMGLPALYPLTAGIVLLSLVTLYHKVEFKVLWRMLLLDMKLPLNSLYVFLAIGAITASWRASGTIAMIIYYGSRLIDPQWFIPCCFWLTAFMSLLLGTAFGATGTVGLTLIVMAKAAGVSLPLAAGAIISGAFVGDVCSPMSSSTNLMAIMTKSSIHRLIGRLMRQALLPFCLASLLFILLSRQEAAAAIESSLIEEMGRAFVMSPWTLLPAAVVLLLILCKVKISRAITASCLVAAFAAWLIQGQAPGSVLWSIVFGYYMPEGSALKTVMDGGGIMSMAYSEMILLVSALYSGLFKGTGMLNPIKDLIRQVSQKASRAVGVTLAALITCLFAPSQVFAMMVTNQFTADLYDQEAEKERELLAFGIASTAMMFSPLVPWNICSTVPAAMLGVGPEYIPLSFYPILFPACYAFSGWIKWKKTNKGLSEKRRHAGVDHS